MAPDDRAHVVGAHRSHGGIEVGLDDAEVVAIVDAPPPPSVSFSPDRRWMLLVERDAMPSILTVAGADARRQFLKVTQVAHVAVRSPPTCSPDSPLSGVISTITSTVTDTNRTAP